MNKKDKEAIEHTYDLYRFAFEQANVGMAIGSRDPDDSLGKFKEVNDELCRMLGYTREEFLQMTPHDVVPPEKLEEYRPIDSGKTVAYETERLAKDGRRIPVELRSRVFKINDTVHVLVVLKDITDKNQMKLELQESRDELEKRVLERSAELTKLQKAINQSEEIVFITNLKGAITYVNPKFESVYGYSSDEALGNTPRILKSGVMDEAAYEMFWETLLSGNPVVGELINKCKDGSLINIEGSANLILDDNGEMISYIAVQRDITKRKRAKDVLKKSEEKYANLVERSNDGIIILQDNLLKYVNSKMAQMTGYEQEEVINKKFLEFIAPSHRAIGIDRYKKRLAGIDVPNEYEMSVLHKDGREISVEINASITEYEDAPADMAIVRDITERKRIEKNLHDSEEKYRSLFDNMLDGFAIHEVIFDENGDPVDYIFLEANQAFEKLTQLKRKDIIGTKVTEVLPGIENDPADWIRRYGKVALTGEPIRFEQYAELLDQWYAVLAYSTKKGYFVTVFEDITERKRIEKQVIEYSENLEERVKQRTLEVQMATEEFEQIFNLSVDMICIADLRTSYFTKVNPTFCKVLGYSEQELLASPLTDFIHPDDIERTSQCIDDQLKRGELIISFENRYICKDGSIKFLEWGASPMSEKGITYSIARDITERKRAEKELEDMRAKAAIADRLSVVGQLASGVAHEVRNPLAIISNIVYLLKLKLDDSSKDIQEYLDKIGNEVFRSSHIIEGLLDLARTKVPELKKASIGSLFDHVFKHTVIPENIKVIKKYDIASSIASIDEMQIERVFGNLVQNAIHAMQKGGILTVDIAMNNGYIHISITDTGRGIHPDNMGKVFDPMFTTKVDMGGTGVGLAICRTIVGAHGGDIEVNSEIDKGATFTVKLPVERERNDR
ncbi:MAG: PAS domain S-box protein [Chloroflexi bacterium]|jgi:PAS domain S-box-containing protein|nr:PAS domain S-box protein [Chloroflexota bacterium]MBT7290282.1 PAS domain S-box protein [Chloroflexota bacterium]